MSVILEWFAYEQKKKQLNREETSKNFWARIKAAQDTQHKEKILSNDKMVIKKYQYGHLKADPFYEQRNMMYPHKKYERRQGNQ